MLSKLKHTAIRSYTNALGWKTKRKIVVIESDDWGSIRMPSKKAVLQLQSLGFAVEKCAYMQNDCLESNEDLQELFDVLVGRKNTPIITANFLTANPDFGRIQQNDFNSYYYENLAQTLAQYPNHDQVQKLWLEGMNMGFFRPQLHGREHLNISRWMTDLQNNNTETHQAFELKTFGVSGNVVKRTRGSYQAAFDLGEPKYKVDLKKILEDAVSQFESQFGFKPKTFIAPNYTWGDEVEQATAEFGITHLQGVNVQKLPKRRTDALKTKRNILGYKNKQQQTYLIRNATFEPFEDRNKDYIQDTLKEIRNAFLWNKPAIISMHRVNFVGGINPNNRTRNLGLFTQLLDKIEHKWPEVEYMSSDQLAKLIEN